MIAVRVPAGKLPETSFKIFLRVPPTTSPSTSPTPDFVNLAFIVSTTEVTMSTSTPRFRTVISAGWTSEKERACWRLSEMCDSVSVVSENNEPFCFMSTSILTWRTASRVSEAVILRARYLWCVGEGRGRNFRDAVGLYGP